jgi:protein O-mannosyl-transferase
MTDIRRATVKQMANKIKGYGKHPRFAFFLGAGVSRQSGIITAGEMINHFKRCILDECCPDGLKTGEEKDQWLAAQGWYKKEGGEYRSLFEQYEPKEIGRQRYIESIIEGREPSFGYVVLANLMASNYTNTIITTNFDDLVYSACTSYTGIRPIVYAYGVMASEMRITAQRPKILKLHGDYLYSTLKNTDSEIAEQDPNMARQLTQVLNEYGLIVAGYSGGDESIMEILSKISERNDLYWCIRRGDEPSDVVTKLIADKGGFIVEIQGFDEMMDEIRPIVGFDVGKMLGSIQERQDQMIEKLKSFAPRYSADILSETVEALQKQASQEQEQIKKIQSLDFFTKALKAQKARDFKQAEDLYRKAIELNPDAPSYINLGSVLSEDKARYSEAEAAYRKAIELDPNIAAAYYNFGTILAKDETRYSEAEAAYRKAIELDPNYARAFNNLGTMLAKGETHHTEAEAAFRKAIELNPNYAGAYYNLGNLLFKDETRHSEAEAAYRKAIELDPDDAAAYYNLGYVLAKDETRHSEAEAAFRKAIELDPNDAGAFNNLGAILAKDTRHSEAEAAFRKAIELDPNDVSPYKSLVMLLRLQDKEVESVPFAERWLQLDSQSADPLLALAAIHKKLRHEIESNEYAARARELIKPDDWYTLACLESVCGNTDAAIGNLKRAAQKDSFNPKWAKGDPDLEWIRDDPRFGEIVGREET